MPTVEVVAKRRGVTVHDTRTGREYLLKPGQHRLMPGKYQIEVTDVELIGPSARLRRTLRLNLVPGAGRVGRCRLPYLVGYRAARWRRSRRAQHRDLPYDGSSRNFKLLY